MLIESAAVRALNALLDSEPWARARLAPFAGESIEVRAPLAPALRFSIAEGGRLAPAADAFSPSLVIRLEAALPAAVLPTSRGEEALLRAIEADGNAALAAEVLYLLRHLRWDVEEGLSVWVGDVAAHRIVATAREFARLQGDAARRLAEGVIEYALEEQPLLVPRTGLEALAAGIGRLRERLDELEARLGRLAARR